MASRAYQPPQHADLCPHSRGAAGRAVLLPGRTAAIQRLRPLGGAGRLPACQHHRLFRRLSGARLAADVEYRPDARSRSPTSLLVATCLLLLAADTDRTHRRLVAVGRDHHPVPRNPGLRPARISRRPEGQRAGDAGWPNGRPPSRWWRSRSCWPAPRCDKIISYATQTGIVLLWIAAIVTLYTGYDYFRAGLKHIVDE